MPTELPLITAFLMGVLGSVHCIGMCGGIASVLTMSLPEPVRSSPRRMLPYLLMYNGGRIASYAVAGSALGFVGAASSTLFASHTARFVGLVISASFLIALGLYLGGWWRILSVLEQFGARLWRHLEPLGRRFLPVRTPVHALGLGLVWGWLPCGLVYAALAWSLMGGSALGGGMLMLAFGLGTLPMLLSIGTASRWFAALSTRLAVRRTAGALIIGFGLYALAGAGAHLGDINHADSSYHHSMWTAGLTINADRTNRIHKQ